MHMANELLSMPIAGTSLALAAGSLGLVCKKCQQSVSTDRFALMGILGAFIFAAQMINIQLPCMPGTSGHLIGAVLLSIILGPHAGALVISSVVMVQCLIFQDGGLLALGCNIINMALVPSYAGYAVYSLVAPKSSSSDWRFYAGTMAGAFLAVESGAVLVPVEAYFSGILLVPFKTFLLTMLSVHLIIGILEAVLTVAVLAYMHQIKPDICWRTALENDKSSNKILLISLIGATVVIGGIISLFASDLPDGLEWAVNESSSAKVIAEPSNAVRMADKLHSAIALAPNYAPRTAVSSSTGSDAVTVEPLWMSAIGISGSVLTMLLIWFTAKLIRRRTLLVNQ